MNFADKIPPLLTGDELKEALTFLPRYDPCIRNATASERLMALNQIFDIYCPSVMTCEIYYKLYFSFVRALQKKNTIDAVKQSNFNRVYPYNHGIIGGSDSFTIVGVSGIGKSTAISKAISVITREDFLVYNNTKIIPFLTIQTPSDCSLKGLLLEVLRTVDSILQTRYYNDAIRARATLDMLIGLVSQVCLNHICSLIIDEAQNLVGSKSGKGLVNSLVQLINNSGISLCFVGTLECTPFFESAFQLARRSVGLSYSSLTYGEHFQKLCQTVFSYQYTNIPSMLDESVVEWLYLHSNGITAIVVGLVQSAQEIAILEGYEQLNLHTLNEAYKRRFGMIHGYLETLRNTKGTLVKKQTIDIPTVCNNVSQGCIFTDSTKEVKGGKIDAVGYLKQFVCIEEIAV